MRVGFAEPMPITKQTQPHKQPQRFKEVWVDNVLDAGWIKIIGKRKVLVPIETAEDTSTAL